MVAVCLVEDDLIMGESLQQRFALEGVECVWYKTAEEALADMPKRRFGAMVSDIRLPDMSGEELYDELLARGTAAMPVIFMTGYGTVDQAVRLLKKGAVDYVTKPFDLDELLEKLQGLVPELFLADQVDEPVLGISRAMRQIEQQLARAVRFDVPVLITGPSGAGKEHAALYFRDRLADGREMPFVSVNCAALTETLLEAELFGHEKGAFTGADRQRPGLFESAHGGVLFLDEIGEMSLAMQAKLLRALQSGVIRRVGGRKDIAVDVRLVCATNRDLPGMIREGQFREDLFYRINVVHVEIPPLAQRPEDIRWYAARLLAACQPAADGAQFRFSEAVERWMLEQPWPGNIRQLKNMIERACVNASSPLLDLSLFADERACAQEAGDLSLKAFMEQCERDRIARELELHDWQVSETARALGISRKNLWEKMRKYGL